MLGRVQIVGGRFFLVVPVGQLLPAPEILRIGVDDLAHLRNGPRVIATLPHDPCGPPAENQRRVIGPGPGVASANRFVVAAETGQEFRHHVVGLGVAR